MQGYLKLTFLCHKISLDVRLPHYVNLSKCPFTLSPVYKQMVFSLFTWAVVAGVSANGSWIVGFALFVVNLHAKSVCLCLLISIFFRVTLHKLFKIKFCL